MKKDKAKVLDDVWTPEHVKSFLSVRPHDNTDEDFHMLLKAYQSMRADDFTLFIEYFREENRQINDTGIDGRSVLEIVTEHRHGSESATLLKAAGAR